MVVNYTGTAVNQRVFNVTTGTIALGRYLRTSTPTTGTTNVTSTGLYTTTASGSLGNFSNSTSNGLTLTLNSGSANFAGTSASQTAGYQLGGTVQDFAAGVLSGSFTSTVTAEFGSISPVVVNYTGTAVSQRVFTTSTSTLALGAVHQGATVSGPSVVVTSTGLNATTASGTLGSFAGGPSGFALGLTAGSAAFLGATTPQTATYTLTGTGSILGSITGTYSSLVDAEFGSIPNVNVAVSGQVYSGQSTWATNGSGNWGTLTGTGANAFGANWGTNQGSPGLDASFATTDTATFGEAAGSGTVVVLLNGASPSLNGITFNNSSASYDLDIGSGGTGRITLAAGGTAASTINVQAGSHAIRTGLTLESNLEVVLGANSALTLQSAITGSNRSLRMSGASSSILTIAGNNTYTGATLIDSGTLKVNGSIASGTLSLAAASWLTGTGSVAGVLTGAGSVGPGSSPGVLTASRLSSSAMAFAFELTASGSSVWSDPGSLNDVLRLTGATPFDVALGSGNAVNVYFDVDSIAPWESFQGGFFTDAQADFLADVDNATYNYYVKSAGGSVSYNGTNYVGISTWAATNMPNFTGVTLVTKPVTTDFGSGAVSGYTTDFIVVPEPNTLASGAIGLVLASWWLRQRCRNPLRRV